MPVIALDAPAVEAVPAHTVRPGWTWAVWGSRRHYLAGDGRTACGRRWDGGFTGLAHSPRLRCLTCERALKKKNCKSPETRRIGGQRF